MTQCLQSHRHCFKNAVYEGFSLPDRGRVINISFHNMHFSSMCTVSTCYLYRELFYVLYTYVGYVDTILPGCMTDSVFVITPPLLNVVYNGVSLPHRGTVIHISLTCISGAI